MNYSSVQSILDAGIENMQTLRDNVKQDDGVDTIEGVSWFYFEGVACTSIYVSGNSLIGLGANIEHFKFNRRDTALYYLYREEGTLNSIIKFLKIKWKGYSPHNYDSEEAMQEFDLLLFEDGTIMVHAIKFSSVANDGAYSLVTSNETYTYSLSNDIPNLTFYPNKENGFDLVYEIAEFYAQKFLIRHGLEVYTRVDGAIVSLGEVVVTSDLFLSSGFEGVPTSDELINFENPEVLLWYDSEDSIPSLAATVIATPKDNQNVITNAIDLTHESIKGIEDAIVDCEGELSISVSFDNKATWKAWNGEQWASLSESFTGMGKDVLESITFDQWNLEFLGATTMFIRLVLTDTSQIIKEIYFDYAN